MIYYCFKCGTKLTDEDKVKDTCPNCNTKLSSRMNSVKHRFLAIFLLLLAIFVTYICYIIWDYKLT